MTGKQEIYVVYRNSIEGCTEIVWAFTNKKIAEQYMIEMNSKASKYLTYYVQDVFVD